MSFTDEDLKRLKELQNMNPTSSLGSAIANWRCICGRNASIEHSIGGYCISKEIIEKLLARLEAAEEVCYACNCVDVISRQCKSEWRKAAEK